MVRYGTYFVWLLGWGLSGMERLASSYATADIALNFIRERKPPRPHGHSYCKAISLEEKNKVSQNIKGKKKQ